MDALRRGSLRPDAETRSGATKGTRLSGPPSGEGTRALSNTDLVDALCNVSIPLREARRVHLAFYGILIPHLFMADVLKRVGQCLGAGRIEAAATHGAELAGILVALERGMAEGERETRNVIAISFTRDSELEMFFDELRPLMGPRLRGQLQGR